MNTKLAAWKRRITGSLKVEIIGGVLLGLALGVACYFLLWGVGEYILSSYVEPAQSSRVLETAAAQFQEYIDENQIASNDWDQISAWESGTNDVYVLRVSGSGKGGGQLKLREPRGNSDGVQATLPITYTDGVWDTHFLLIPSGYWRIVAVALSMLLSVALFLAVCYRLLKKKMGYMLEIETGVSILESGDLGYRIPLKGRDELYRLALSLNAMSRSFSERMLLEQQSIQSGREIISDLSHDIRTPLTILSGYIPLLLASEPLTEVQREYLTRIQGKTEQMRKRVEELLGYATVYSGELKIEKVPLQGAVLFRQLTDELGPLADVSAQNNLPEDAMILADPRLLARLFDNIISNIHQHGDLTKPVRVLGEIRHHRWHIEIENAVRPGKDSAGKSLGLKISRYILQCHGGSIRISEAGGLFKTIIDIPAAQDG